MTKYYPMMLNLENKKCVVIGGGEIAFRKIKELLEYGSQIIVVSKNIDERIKQLQNSNIILIKDSYNKKYLENAFIVIASTDDKLVNNEIFNDCNERNILINVVDEPKNCSFIVPSKVRRGDLTISISTNGKSPLLARMIREDLEKIYDENYEQYVNFLGEVRKDVIEKVKNPVVKREILENIIRADYLNQIKSVGVKVVKEEINMLLIEILKDEDLK